MAQSLGTPTSELPPVAPNAFPGSVNDAREAAIWQRLRQRKFTQGGNVFAASVAGAATSVVLTFDRVEADVNYLVTGNANWDTTVYTPTADKLVDQVTVRFGTAAPGGGGTVDVQIERSD